MDLLGELTGGGDHDGPGLIRTALGAVLGIQQVVQRGHQEGGCFAGPGFCLARHTASCQGQRQGALLDGGAMAEAALVERLDQARMDGQVSKCLLCQMPRLGGCIVLHQVGISRQNRCSQEATAPGIIAITRSQAESVPASSGSEH